MTLRYPSCLAGLLLAVVPLRGQTVAPAFSSNYTVVVLGAVPSLPTPYGGLTFLPADPNTILIGGAANAFAGKIYSIGVARDASNHITGFSGAAVFFANGNGVSGGIDGGLAYGPSNVLFYTSYSDNRIGQLKPGSTNVDKLIDMTAVGVASSVGSLFFVPPGFAGAGRLKIASYNAYKFYDATIAPDGAGTFDIAVHGTGDNFIGGPEGFIYVPGANPVFGSDSLLVSEYQSGVISTYVIDANGDPVIATRQLFVTGLSGAEGAAVDPLTGDFLFSTFNGGNRVIAVRGFIAPVQPIKLSIQQRTNAVIVSWSATPTNWVLETGPTLVNGLWTNNVIPPTQLDGTNSVTTMIDGQARFWRLRYQP